MSASFCKAQDIVDISQFFLLLPLSACSVFFLCFSDLALEIGYSISSLVFSMILFRVLRMTYGHLNTLPYQVELPNFQNQILSILDLVTNTSHLCLVLVLHETQCYYPRNCRASSNSSKIAQKILLFFLWNEWSAIISPIHQII